MLLSWRHRMEFFFVKALYAGFGALPMETASAIGGWLGRTFGPLLKVTEVAERNMKRAFPEYTQSQIHGLLKKMWENLGRTAAEFPHMTQRKGASYEAITEVEGLEHIQPYLGKNQSVIFFSAHMANWEVIPKTIFEKGFPDLHLIYRRSNNPYLDTFILDVRSHYEAGCMPKGSVGARQLINAIKKGTTIGMLVDQKQNDGISVPFFGREAMTAPAIANLAFKYGVPLLPISAHRTHGIHFKVRFHPPIILTPTGNEEQDTYQAMCNINQMIEGWIREYPEQWLWVHNRWPKGS